MRNKIKTKDMTRFDWLDLRRTSIGGSDVATILGFNKYKSPYQLWLDKTGQIDIDTTDPSEAAYWGNVFEQSVAEEFSIRAEKKVRQDNHMYFHKEYDFLSVNVDRQIVEKCHPGMQDGQYVFSRQVDGRKHTTTIHLSGEVLSQRL